MTLGDKISKLRKDNNYTQEQLAGILGVSRQSVSKWESNLAYPETDKLIRMSEMFQCSLDYLLKDDEEMTSDQQQWALDDILHGCHRLSSQQIQNERKKAGFLCPPSLRYGQNTGKSRFCQMSMTKA